MPDQTDQSIRPSNPGAQAPSALSRIVSTRRTLFHRVGLAALAGGGAVALAACAEDPPAAAPTSEAGPSSSAPSSPASSAPSPSETASASESATPSASASTEPEGTKIATAQVPVGGGAVVDETYVVTQPSAGEFKAFTSICTHQGCPVSSVTDGEIVCDCHGSHFSITDGSPVAGPATSALAAKKVEVAGSNLYVSG